MKLIKEMRDIHHIFSQEELANVSQENAQLNIEIQELKQEQKNVNGEYSSRIKKLETKRNETSLKIVCKAEDRSVFCYLRRNYDNRTIEYIDMDGNIVEVQNFSANDFRKQLELKEEVAQSKLSKIKYFGMKYFYDAFRNIQEIDINSTDAQIANSLEENKTKFISLCIRSLVEEQAILELEDDVEFDAMYEIVNSWYEQFMKNYCEEPVKEDFETIEEEAKAKVLNDAFSSADYPFTNNEDKPEWL